MEADLTQPYPLIRCTTCGTASTVGSAPPELYATGTYQSDVPRGAGLVASVLRLFVGERVRITKLAHPPPATLLDVGAGRGRFVLAAERVGYATQGIEPAGARVHEAASQGARVRQAGIEDADVRRNSYDIATLWHVLEHVDDPARALGQVASWVRPGGTVVVAVPNLSSWQARIGGTRWFHLDVPRHRTHFTRTGLLSLVDAVGLVVVREHHFLLEHNAFGMWQTWVNHLTSHPSYLYNLLKRNASLSVRDVLATAICVPLAPVAVAAELTAGLVRRGGTVVITARVEHCSTSVFAPFSAEPA